MLAYVTAAMAGCAQGRDIESLGDGVFATSARGYQVDAQRDVMRRAKAFCEGKGLLLRVDDLGAVNMEMGFFRVTVTFRCLEAGHPDLTPPAPV